MVDKRFLYLLVFSPWLGALKCQLRLAKFQYCCLWCCKLSFSWVRFSVPWLPCSSWLLIDMSIQSPNFGHWNGYIPDSRNFKMTSLMQNRIWMNRFFAWIWDLLLFHSYFDDSSNLAGHDFCYVMLTIKFNERGAQVILGAKTLWISNF